MHTDSSNPTYIIALLSSRQLVHLYVETTGSEPHNRAITRPDSSNLLSQYPRGGKLNTYLYNSVKDLLEHEH